MLSKCRINGKVRVTFSLPPREGEDWVCVVGDFNSVSTVTITRTRRAAQN